MRSFPSRYALSGCAAAAVLAGCGILPFDSAQGTPAQADMQPPVGALGAMRQTIAHRTAFAKTFRVLYRFNGSDGQQPQAGLINVNGTLYGTTNFGGKYGQGTVFSITTGGSENVLHSFKGGADGSNPRSGLLDVKATLYGTTSSGGLYGKGTVFSLTTSGDSSGSERVLHSFGNGSDGALPTAGLIDVSGTLYGTTAGGGSGCGGYGCGTVYSITADGSEKVLYSFAGSRHGVSPYGGLINVHGTLFGTTVEGGSSGYGTIYSISTGGSENVLYSSAQQVMVGIREATCST
ncbi:MAG: choice-of-anchor tandem repeat GloVer-containing protein [Candidatus Cybelea sp.]